MKRLYNFLDKRSVFHWLLFVNVVSGLTGFSLGLRSPFADAVGYWNMARSFGHGTFSSWYFLPVSAPETLRTWGYPFFIFLCQQIYDSYLTVQLLQLAIYGTSVYLMLRLIQHFDSSLIYRNVFLLLLAFNIKLPFYAGQINAEMLCIFSVALYSFIFYFQKESFLKCVLLALCGFCIFQFRPSFLLFPVFFLLYKLVCNRDNIKYYAASFSLYLILLLPFGFWNYENHGIFKVTPMEGGGGVVHIGYWCPKLPEGFRENFYWGNVCVADYTQPSFVSDEERQSNVAKFEGEWNEINSEIASLLSEDDRQQIALMEENNPGQFVLYPGKYTAAREKLLFEKTLQHVEDEPWFYLKTRVYTFARLWFTGISKDEWNNANGLVGKATALYPFLSSFFFIFLGLIFITTSFVIGFLKWSRFYFLFLLTVYYGLIHTPFAFQSRFTVPVHFLILVMSSFAIVRILHGRRVTEPTIENTG
jgi:hypothetical protein